MGQINHVDVVTINRPNVQISETIRIIDHRKQREVRWITDVGELSEIWIDNWCVKHLLNKPDDYRIMLRALEGETYKPFFQGYNDSEAELGERGITLGHFGWYPLRRTSVMDLQAEWAGIESVAIHLADELPELMALLELMDALMLDKCRAVAEGPAVYIKLWENLSIETIGVQQFRGRIVPQYRKMIEILRSHGKRLIVHADGKLRPIMDDLAALDLDIDSFSEPPEGDMSIAEARAKWPNKFLWLTPPQGLYVRDENSLKDRVQRMTAAASSRQFCFLISEGIPPGRDEAIAGVLSALKP
ncbi:MAG: hypothetical protein BroJett038_35330 [Chloroflexota bacterium]|nr:MAG: hypothetical protein BroJett038_35330 [Chloroflexota bacterium]